MLTSNRARRRARLIAIAAALGLGLSGIGIGSAAMAVTPGVEVRDGDLGTTRPADGGWWVEKDAGATATAAVTKNAYDASIAMELHLPSTSAKAYVYRSYPAAERPTDLLSLLDGASYTYTGTNVNFQVEMVFLPVDVATYGAQGTTPCTSAVAWGLSTNADACYTVMKWEPFERPTTWKTVDLSQDVAADSPSQTGGWISQKRLGSFAGPGAFIGQTLTTYLAQVASLEVTAMVFGAGSGTAGPVSGFVKDIAFDGVDYAFALTPQAPSAPPAADTEGLNELIEDEGIDVESDTEDFEIDGGSVDGVDSSAPIDATYQGWTGEDDFVDVFSFSSAVFVGSFPVIDGTVRLTGLDLRHLSGGVHHLLLVGQSSGALAVVQFTVLGAAALAATGSTVMPALVFGAGLLLVVGAVAVLRTGRRAS